jgi:DtxR family Mn-dependent transcriptional regulator
MPKSSKPIAHSQASNPIGADAPEGAPATKLITSSHEDYLKGIYTLAAGGVEVSNSALAHHLGVSPASATNMVKKLSDLGLVTYTPYQDIRLTDSGEKVALEVLRHHRLLELYLHDKLNLSWDQVHAEAERLEHVLSETLEDAMAAALGNPTVDPHGDPIPSKDGRVEQVGGILLSEAEIDRAYRVVRVLVQDPERLIYLGSLRLYPNAAVTVLRRAPFFGPLLVEVDGEYHALAHDMAEYLVVA